MVTHTIKSDAISLFHLPISVAKGRAFLVVWYHLVWKLKNHVDRTSWRRHPCVLASLALRKIDNMKTNNQEEYFISSREGRVSIIPPSFSKGEKGKMGFPNNKKLWNWHEPSGWSLQ